VCSGVDLSVSACSSPLVMNITRNASEPLGMFQAGHASAKLLASSTGSLAVSYQSAYGVGSYTRTTWFGVASWASSLVALNSTFSGFDASGALISSPASGWALQSNSPLAGFRRDSAGRLLLRGTDGLLITWSPESGLQAFVQR
jgi:hypothetical protein